MQLSPSPRLPVVRFGILGFAILSFLSSSVSKKMFAVAFSTASRGHVHVRACAVHVVVAPAVSVCSRFGSFQQQQPLAMSRRGGVLRLQSRRKMTAFATDDDHAMTTASMSSMSSMSSSASISTSISTEVTAVIDQEEKEKTSESTSFFTSTDRMYLQHAVDLARRGLTHTFPNPAVGCVIVQTSTTTTCVNDDDDSNNDNNNNSRVVIIGQGFHPRAGWPHAEIFALLQAAHHVPCGVTAAQAVVDDDTSTIQTLQLQELSETYRLEGAAALFRNCCCSSSRRPPNDAATTTTAYVTLEPCCHTGRTPPCAATMVEAGIDRVVIGVRDPNPVVDGGGMAVLLQKGRRPLLHTNAGDAAAAAGDGCDTTMTTQVLVAPQNEQVQQACEQLIRNFRKRITMPAASSGEQDTTTSSFTGKQKRALRAAFGRRQQTKSAMSVDWGNGASLLLTYPEDDDDAEEDSSTRILEQAVQDLVIAPEWMENLDDVLWQHELVQVKLNRAVDKRKQAEALGRRIAHALGAQLVQSKGHGVLLYRPGMPPVLSVTHDGEGVIKE